ncbi:MAG TPA: hypothetical protein PKY05_13380, partial [Fibrobacteria bacterium]|nr:hypothetical protein [Fibrobacteria bacterium]
MKILHLGASNFAPGGVRTYLLQVAQGQRLRGWTPMIAELLPEPGHADILDHSFANLTELVQTVARIRPDAIHLHAPLPDYRGIGSNSVQTAHEHTAYCPAGSKLLERDRKQCHMPSGTLSCLVRHYVDRCGSRHPANLVRKLALTRNAKG